MTGTLSDRFLVLLRHGDTENTYGGDGSRIVGAIVLHAVNEGIPKALVYKLLADPQNRGGFAALRRRRNLERWFTTVWDGATRKAEASPVIRDRQEAVLRAQEFLEGAQGLPWPGRGGATDLAVLTAVVSICQRVGKVTAVPMSVREVAEAAKVGSSTAARSLARLVAAGWLRPGVVSDGAAPSSYSLDVRHRDNRSYTGSVGPDCPSDARRSDAFRWAGLGLSALRVFEFLDCDEPRTATDLAEPLGVKAGTVRRHLANLKKYDLAVPDDDGWRRGDADLGHVADALGVAGASFAQKRRHQNERAARAAAFSSRGSAPASAPGPPGAPAPLPATGRALQADTWRATA